MGFIFEDDTLVEPDSLAEPQSRNALDNNLLDVNQLLESVCIISYFWYSGLMHNKSLTAFSKMWRWQ